jgi:diguanylate cyclase (GGDEF)-like protein
LKRSAKRNFVAVVGLALPVVIAAAALVRQPVSTIRSAIKSYRPAYETLAELARIRSLLSSLQGESHSSVAGTMHREMDDLEALLSEDLEQRERFDRLSDLVRKRTSLADPLQARDQDVLVREIGDLLTEMEHEENARLERAEAATRSAVRSVTQFTGVAGLAAVSIFLLALSLTQWETVRRRRTAKSVAKLITRQQDLEDRLHYLDKYDPLTGLPNRRYLVEMLDQEIRCAKKGRRFLSVLIADINRLKHINDLFGPEAGDEVLRRIAERLRAALGERGIVARLGGSEFAVVHFDVSPQFDAVAAAESIQTAISANIPAGEQDFVVTSNAGIAVYPYNGNDALTLLKKADLALGRARSQGRNTVQVFDENITRSMSELFYLEKRLFRALKNGEYLVHYQPCCDLATKEVGGAEALIKWKNGDLGTVSASKFIPLLEDTGMIIDVGRWVLETACGQIREWQEMKGGSPVSVNLSLVQFRDKYLIGTVADVIKGFKLDPTHLTLEVTESVCLHDMEFAIKTLKQLKDMGVSLSVDDFGTGYSSLSYLKKLPVDSIKIDISFVRDVTRDQDTASIVTAITSLARGLSLKTVAEGVETEEQRKILHLLRCDMGQGFYFSPAVSAAEFERFVAGGPGAAGKGF